MSGVFSFGISTSFSGVMDPAQLRGKVLALVPSPVDSDNIELPTIMKHDEGDFAARPEVGESLDEDTRISARNSPEMLRLGKEKQEFFNEVHSVISAFVESNALKELSHDWLHLFATLSKPEEMQHSIPGTAGGIEDHDLSNSGASSFFIELMSRLARSSTSQNAVRDLFKIMERMQGFEQSEEVQKVMEDFKQELSGAFDVEILTKFWNCVSELLGEVKEDKGVEKFFLDLGSFVGLSVKYTTKISKEETKKKVEALMKGGRYLLRDEKWGTLFQRLLEYYDAMVSSINEIERRKAIISKLNLLQKRLLFEKMPEVVVDSAAIKNVKKALLPVLNGQLRDVAIPPMKVVTEHFDVTLSNMTLSAESNIEEEMEIRTADQTHPVDNGEFGTTKLSQLQLSINIMPQFSHFKFHYKKRGSVAKTDRAHAVAALALTAERMKLHVVWNLQRESDLTPCASLAEVNCDLGNVSIHVVDTNDLFDTVLAPLLSNMIKQQITSTLETNLKKQLNEIHSQMDHLLVSSVEEQMKGKSQQSGDISLATVVK